MMSKKHSPFAALTSREQQERWLEFQSTRLPYIEGEVDTTLSERDSEWLGRGVERQMEQMTATQNQQGRYIDPPDHKTTAQSFQKTNHRQYDAIIRRMMDAEKQAVKHQSSVPVSPM